MIAKDIAAYAETHWKDEPKYYQPVREISKEKKDGKPLADSDIEMYAFDDIIGDLFTGSPCKTADALCVGRDIGSKKGQKNPCVYLIEFKRGFAEKKQADSQPNVTKRTCGKLEKRGFPGVTCPKDGLKDAFYQKLEAMEQGECPRWKECTGESRVCKDYSLIKEQKKSRKEEMKNSIRLKAVESYAVLSRACFPECADLPGDGVKLAYWAVTDPPAEKAMQEILSNQRKPGTKPDGTHPAYCAEIKNALKRLTDKLNRNGKKIPYLYDDVKAMTAQEFLAYLPNITSQP